MTVRGLGKLPPRAKSMFNAIYAQVADGRDSLKATRITWELLKANYKPISATGMKSIAMPKPAEARVEGNSTYIDVLIGYPSPKDKDVMLAPAVWKKPIGGVLKGDMEHMYKRLAEGKQVDNTLLSNYEGWVPVADKFWHVGDELWGRVELPANHKMTPVFMEGWKNGEFGVSVEYGFNQENVDYTIVDGQLIPYLPDADITGFSFTTDPALETKNNGEK